MLKRNPDFIGVYDNALSSEECEELISFFECSPKTIGEITKIGKGLHVDRDVKSNIELRRSFVSETPIIFERLQKYTDKYIDEYESLNYIYPCDLVDRYTFQKFQNDDDGFKVWHTEHIPPEPHNKRVLVWMFYLNDAKSGTQFMHYPTVKSKKGRLIIWPSAFTHTHRSEPNKGLKYIMSGWISYVFAT